MPRFPNQSPLLPLATLLPSFRGFSASFSKIKQATDCLRSLILQHRAPASIVFYSSREIASFFGLSQRTAILIIEQLETEGLLLRIRASHTKMLGTMDSTHSLVQGVVGLPMWLHGFCYFSYYKRLCRVLGDLLWERRFVLDTMIYYENEDLKPGFTERILRHKINFAVWLQPFPHNHETILSLKDHGVHSLVVSDEKSPLIPLDVFMNFKPAYEKVLTHWKDTLDIHRIIVVQGMDYTRSRGRFFARFASERGFQCETRSSSPELAAQLLCDKSLDSKTAIALMDENATLGFLHFDPSSFKELAHRHRILFGNDYIAVAFARSEELNIERIVPPINDSIVVLSQKILQWHSGDHSTKTTRIDAWADLAYPLQQYL